MCLSRLLRGLLDGIYGWKKRSYGARDPDAAVQPKSQSLRERCRIETRAAAQVG